MIRPSISKSIFFVLLLFFVKSIFSRAIENESNEFDKLSKIRAQLKKINKPAVKTINSPDGDIIDCVLFQDQPAFDLSELKNQNTTLELVEWPKGYNINKDKTSSGIQNIQLWSDSGEECPEGTIPILRTTEQHLLTASKKEQNNITSGHEYAIASVPVGQYYGARAVLNVWAPKTNEFDFSLGQMWLVSGTFENNDLNTMEAGWQVYPQRNNGDKNPRLFCYWTRDTYKSTGCQNLECPGFVQTNNKIALGAAIKPVSSYNGKQCNIDLMIKKDPKTSNWWLSYGSGTLIGYWPSSIFTHLKSHADIINFGGEIYNNAVNIHTTTQMGSGHFSKEGFSKSAYFRHLQFVNSKNHLISFPLSNLKTSVTNPNCYDIKTFSDKHFGTQFYYGGPGKNPKCP